MISEEQIGDDVQGVGLVIIWDIMPAFEWRDWRKLRESDVRAKIWTWDLPCRSDYYQKGKFDVAFSDTFFHDNLLITGKEWEIKKLWQWLWLFVRILLRFQGNAAIWKPYYCNLSRDLRSYVFKTAGFQAVELSHTVSENLYYIAKWWGHGLDSLIIPVKYSGCTQCA